MTPYQQYNGNYEKRAYKVRTKDGEDYPLCWPNADTFHTMDGKGVRIKGEDVESISPTEVDL